MNEKNNLLQSVSGELQKTIERFDELQDFYAKFCRQRNDFPAQGNYDLIVLAELFSDLYTCVETAFVRISKCFENNLDREKWHSHLLDKMIITVPQIRPRVIADSTYDLLKEFLRFRHFRRYYFELNYNRDSMDALEKNFVSVIALVKNDLTAFISYIQSLRT